MTEENKFFFEYTENSTELYREAQLPEEFNLKSFFEEPSSNDLFIEVEASSFEEENIFRIQENFEFPTHLKEKFVRLFSESSQKSEKNIFTKELKKTKETKFRRVKRIKKGRKVRKRKLAKSEITKNACCNIVQKTISLIKKGEFDEKLEKIGANFNVETEEFKLYIVNEKTRFTGTKALEKFLGEKSANRMVFAKFLSWFLREKYIRYAIKSGEMSNLAAYIKFKNEVILPLL